MFRSQTAIRHMLNLLETHGFLRSRGLEHGGIVLDITAAGHAALDDPTALDGLVSTRTEPSPAPRKPLERAAKKDEPRRDVDDMLFEKLRAWRLEQARERKVPPYVVFHDSHLRNIAACRPATLAALSELRGIGPRKLDLYGEKVVILVREHLQETETGEG